MSRAEPLVSACIIARNEEAFVDECLQAVGALAEELVLGNTGSTDRTVEIAQAHGARVIDVPWGEDFAAARNAVLDKATGRWLLAVDCDELLLADGVADALEHLRSDALPPALLVKILNRYPSGRTIEMLAPRLFARSAGFRYVHAIHEQLNADGAGATLTNLTLDHRGYLPEGACEAKERRNLAIARKMDDSPHANHCVARSAMALKDWSLAIDYSRKLVNSDCGPLLMLEGCAMGGGAALANSDRASFETFIALARTVCPDAPDIRLLELLAAGQDYLHSLERYGMKEPGEYIRAPIFRHEPAGVEAWLTRRAIGHDGTDTHSDSRLSASVDADKAQEEARCLE